MRRRGTTTAAASYYYIVVKWYRCRKHALECKEIGVNDSSEPHTIFNVINVRPTMYIYVYKQRPSESIYIFPLSPLIIHIVSIRYIIQI